MYSFSSWDAMFMDDYLEHYGVPGMHWYVRRYQDRNGQLTPLGMKRYGKEGNRGKRGRTRDLNRLDRNRAYSEYRSKLLTEKANARFSRQKYRAKKHDPKAVVAKDEKTRKWESKAKEYDKLTESAKNMTNRIIQDSLKKKMSIRSKDVVREVDAGRNLAKSIGISMLVPGVYTKNTFQKGTRYRVKDDGKGQWLHKKKKVERLVGTNRTFVYG